MPEEFFAGTTQAGRVLRLFYEHTGYDKFTDEAGESVENPARPVITGTLDGVPVGIETTRVSFAPGRAVTVTTDQGPFTAVAGEDADANAHSDELRKYLEARPPGGWQTAVESRSSDGGEWRFAVAVSSDRLLPELVELRMSDAVARSRDWGRGDPPTDEMIAGHVAARLRHKSWSEVQEAARNPITILGGRAPR